MRPALAVSLASILAACGGGGTSGDGGADGAASPFIVHAPAGDVEVSRIDAAGSARALGVPYAIATGSGPSSTRGAFPDAFDASSFGTACPGTVTSRATGDDCLRLSVWTPNVAPTIAVPVLVFVPAGGVDLADPLYDGVAYTHVGGLLVTVQHRAPVGGLDDANVTRTDAALHDVALAVGWARSNAGAFGGDPARLLVFGAGGGAGLVCAAAAAGLLGGTKIVLESGTCLGVPAARFASLPRAPADVFADPATTLPRLLTGYDADEPAQVSCDARRLAAVWDARGAGVWMYAMTYGTARGAGSELPYVFGNPPPGRMFDGTEQSLVYYVMSSWVDFAADGDPGGAISAWPPWTSAAPMHATFAVGLPAAADATCP